MRRVYATTFLLATLVALPPSPCRADGKPLFVGKTFTGWEGDIGKTWRIEDGCIVGGSLDKSVPRNEFLCTTKTYGDFELKVKFKLLGDRKGANAGVQFRTRRIPKHHEVSGYQADVGQGYWGALYDESRRNRVLAQPDRKLLGKIVKHDDWNEYTIRCEGPHIRLWLNGTPTVDYTEKDAKIERSGIIGLQIHGGAKAQVFYKDIRLEELPAAPGAGAGAKTLFDGRTLTGWKATDFYKPGKVHVKDGAIVMEKGRKMTGVTYARKDFPKMDYEVTLEGKKLEGNDFFCTTTFPVGESFCSLVVGGWGGRVVGLSSINGADASENETNREKEFKPGRWYRFRIRVTARRIEAWIDAEKVVDLDTDGLKIATRIECDACQPFGVATWDTVGAVRDVRVRPLTDAEKRQSALKKP